MESCVCDLRIRPPEHDICHEAPIHSCFTVLSHKITYFAISLHRVASEQADKYRNDGKDHKLAENGSDIAEDVGGRQTSA
jgi:hypothetical protein